MSDEPKKPPSDADKELEREIRADRKFSLEEAIGRMAGPGMMKGVSPVDRRLQAAAEIQTYLSRHLTDAPGVLAGVLLRLIKESAILLDHLDRPLAALESGVRRILESDYLLKELVREADIEWGRVFGERPYLETEGCPPHPDDPYTHVSVRVSLRKLLETLTTDGELKG